MNNKFADREKGFEKKFQMDEELQFKITSRSNKYIGEWASSLLGKNEEETKNYIQEIIKSDLEEAGHEDVFRKIKNDFQIFALIDPHEAWSLVSGVVARPENCSN